MAMNRVWAAVALVGWAGLAGALTEVDAYGLGPNPPVPESWLKLDEDLSIRVRILDAKGNLAGQVDTVQVLRAEVSFFGREDAADREVRLFCTAYFMDANAENSANVIADKPCYEGRLSDATGRFVPLQMDLQFRPVASDPAGTSAVGVMVRDAVVGDGVTLTPTYDWQGGRK